MSTKLQNDMEYANSILNNECNSKPCKCIATVYLKKI